MKKVLPFQDLNPDEKEVKKNECAFYLDLYHKFIKEVIRRPNESYINIFKRVRYLDKNISLNVVNEIVCFNEYDYMMQYAEFFTIVKFFSILIDSNINYLDTVVSDDYFDDKYYVKGSRKFAKKSLINLLRNAFNHNDKDDFELFRLIKSESDIDLAIEIYLRRPNMHLKIAVKDLLNIFSELLRAKSIYDFSILDSTGIELTDGLQIERKIDEGLKLKLTHLYNFDIDGTVIKQEDEKDEFIKEFQFTDNQLIATKNAFNKIVNRYGKESSMVLPFILRDNVPFGMTKIYGYSYDINYFIRDLYNPRSCYKDFINKVNFLEFNRKSDEVEVVYYSVLNPESAIDRSFSLFASYILDSVIPETAPTFELDGNIVSKNHYRNAFVHGRWYPYYDSEGKKLVLTDYEHGDENIMVSSIKEKNEIVIEEKKLYSSLKKYINEDNYDLPLSLIQDDGGNGYHITFRVDGVNYYCNASLTTKAPIFLLLSEKNGQVSVVSGDEFKVFDKLISQTNLDNLDSRMRDFIKTIPSISRKALISLVKTKSDEKYKKSLEEYIYKLLDICTEIKLGANPDDDVMHFHY